MLGDHDIRHVHYAQYQNQSNHPLQPITQGLPPSGRITQTIQQTYYYTPSDTRYQTNQDQQKQDTVRRCASCNVDNTPLWRRGQNGETLCNACGLYLKPKRMKSQLLADKKDASIVCVNCSTQETSLWRKDENGRYLCNACGYVSLIRLYYKLHRTNRPIELRNSVIRRRRRSMALRQNYMQQEETVNRMNSLPSIQTILTETGPRLSQSLPSLHSSEFVSSPLSHSDVDMYSPDLRSPVSEQSFHYGHQKSRSMDYTEPHITPMEKENELLNFANIVSNQEKSPQMNPMSLSAMMLDSNVE